MEAAALRDLDSELAAMAPDTPPDEIQNAVFEIGKRHNFDPLRAWFQDFYETLLGSSQGPRMNSGDTILISACPRRPSRIRCPTAGP